MHAAIALQFILVVMVLRTCRLKMDTVFAARPKEYAPEFTEVFQETVSF